MDSFGHNQNMCPKNAGNIPQWSHKGSPLRYISESLTVERWRQFRKAWLLRNVDSATYADDTLLFLSFFLGVHTVSSWISSCLANISTSMKEHQLQLNLSKTELLVIPASPSIQQEINIKLESTQLTPTKSARNLGIMVDDQLTN